MLLTLASFLVRTIRQRIILVLSTSAIALLLCMFLFNASTGWWDCGVAFGTRHWRTMVMGLTCNLPGLLANRFGWSNQRIDTLAFTIQPMLGIIRQPIDVSIQQLLKAIFVITTIPCIVAAARFARRNDPRFLVAITAPWLMFFCFPAQIHERYLLFAAGIGMVLVGQSIGMTLLAVLLSAATWIMTIAVMLSHGDRTAFGKLLNQNFPQLFTVDSGNVLYRFVKGTFPDMGYAILLCALIFLYLCLRATPRRRQLPLSS
jgi:hypothetical protein